MFPDCGIGILLREAFIPVIPAPLYMAEENLSMEITGRKARKAEGVQAES